MLSDGVIIAAIGIIPPVLGLLYNKSRQAQHRADEAKVIAAKADLVGVQAHERVDTFKAQLDGTEKLVELNRQWLERQERKIADQEVMLAEQQKQMNTVMGQRDRCEAKIATTQADIKLLKAQMMLYKEASEASRDFTDAERRAISEIAKHEREEDNDK